MGSVRDEVLKAQGKILESLIDCESRIAVMYEGFAGAFPGNADFWNRIAVEERQHARVLTALRSVLVRGYLFQDIGRFDQAKIQALHVLLDKINKSAASGEINHAEASTVAMKVECFLQESRFYAEVTSDAPEFASVCQTMRRETERHIAQISALCQDNAKSRQSDPWLRWAD